MKTVVGHDGKCRLSLAFPVLLLASCASSGTEPHAMTAPQHEAAARSEEVASKEHERRYDSSQILPVGIGSLSYVSCPGYTGINCFPSWSSVRNPTELHLSDARRHAELAGRHRAASLALREAEAGSCKNVPEGDQDISPFYHREDIISAGPFAESLGLGGRNVVGAEVLFAALPGMTAEWLQRVVDCHLARNAVLGNAEQTMSYCPLAVPHVKAKVRSLGSGFAVDITSEDERSIKEVIARAEALTKPSPKASN